jgi:acid phosphatase
MRKISTDGNPMLSKLCCALLLSVSCMTYAEPFNISLLKNQIESYQQSGDYLREVAQVNARAEKFIFQEVGKNAERKNPKNLAIVLDIDETSISNFKYIKEREYSSDYNRIQEEILRADAPAIPSTRALYKKALEKGVKVFFVTGRTASLKAATIKNLKSAGYTHWEGLFFKPSNYKEKSIVPFKSGIRKKISEKGYTIVASIGDQMSDLTGGYALKGFKLPNPFYYLH